MITNRKEIKKNLSCNNVLIKVIVEKEDRLEQIDYGYIDFEDINGNSCLCFNALNTFKV